MSLTWVSCRHEDEPLDEQADLFGPYWALVGPDKRDPATPWSFDILDFDNDNESVVSGRTATIEDAKTAVEAWHRLHGFVAGCRERDKDERG